MKRLLLALLLLPSLCYADHSTWKKYQTSTLSTTVVSVKASNSAALAGWYIYNPNASACVVQIFDKATAASVTLGTTVPDIHLTIPPSGGANVGPAGGGIWFNAGIQIAATTTSTGLTACASALDVNVWYY